MMGTVLGGVGSSIAGDVVLDSSTGSSGAFAAVPQLFGDNYTIRDNAWLSLNGPFDLSGTTQIIEDSGELALYGTVTLGTGVIVASDSAKIAVWNDVTGGSGKVTLSGLSVLDLTGLTGSSFALGELSGTGGTVDMGGVTLELGSANSSALFAGALGDGTASGGLIKVGTGALTLAGNSIYTGNTQLNGGSLFVNGAIASKVIAGSGTILGGTGTISGLDLKGTLAPGASLGQIGTLTVSGNAVLRSGSTYRVDLAPGSSDRLSVTGQLSIEKGTTIQVAALDPSANYQTAQVSTIMTGGSVLGSDNLTLSLNSSLLTGTLALNGQAVTLKVLQTGSFQSLGKTSDQKEAGKGVSELPPSPELSRVQNALLGLTDDKARQALSDMVTVDPTNVVLEQSPATKLTGTPAKAKPTDSSPTDAPAKSGIPSRAATALAYFGGRSLPGIVAIEDAELEDLERADWGIWLAPVGAYGTVTAPGNVAWVTGGLQGGIEAYSTLGEADITAGLMVGGQRSAVSATGPDSFSDVQQASVGAYGDWTSGDTSVSASLTQSLESVAASRHLQIADLEYDFTADYLQYSTGLAAELTHGFRLGDGGVVFSPLAGLDVAYLGHGGYAEDGDDLLALVVDPLSAFRASAAVGATLETSTTTEDGTLTASASLQYQRELLDGTRRQTMRFAGGTTKMDVESPAGDLDRALLGLGLSYAASNGLTTSIAYAGSFSANSQAHAVTGRLGSSF